MATDSTPPDSPDAGGPHGEGIETGAVESGEQPEITIVTQYVKDLSFENPGAPATVIQPVEQPDGNVSVHVRRRRLSGDDHEVLLEFNLEAKREDGSVAFILELAYGGVFTLRGFDRKSRRFVLSVECPKLLFPFARRVIADSARDGGYPPVMLGPIDFASLYHQRRTADAQSPNTT